MFYTVILIQLWIFSVIQGHQQHWYIAHGENNLAYHQDKVKKVIKVGDIDYYQGHNDMKIYDHKNAEDYSDGVFHFPAKSYDNERLSIVQTQQKTNQRNGTPKENRNESKDDRKDMNNPYLQHHLRVNHHPSRDKEQTSSLDERIFSTTITKPEEMFTMLNDVDIISAIAENILGPVIKESIMRKEGGKVNANEMSNKVKNTRLKTKNIKRKNPIKMKPSYPILKPHRSASVVEKLQNDLTQFFDTVSAYRNPLDRISNEFKNMIPTFPPEFTKSQPLMTTLKENLKVPAFLYPQPAPTTAPLPISPILPINPDIPFSPKTQVFMQYLAFIMGGAFILAIPEG